MKTCIGIPVCHRIILFAVEECHRRVRLSQEFENETAIEVRPWRAWCMSTVSDRWLPRGDLGEPQKSLYRN